MASSALFSTTAAKVFASVVLVGGAASVAGLGTFGSFTSTTDASAAVASGKVEQCATSWTQSGNALTCASPTVLVGSRPVIGADMTLGQALTDTLNSGTPSAFLKVTVTLPTTADNTFQSKTDGVKFAFTATQRAGEAR